MKAEQCRGARAMLEISRDGLAQLAQVGERTIADFESGRREPTRATLAALQRALEAAGVIFVPGNGQGPGVRLRKGGIITSDDLKAGNGHE